ncbi:MAG: hypothetical protein ACJ8E3_03895 [Sphingomicrobium sp.]
MRLLPAGLCALALAACGDTSPAPEQPTIKVRSAEQNQLHQLDALNLAIGLKRAIYDAGYTCKRITDAGFVAEWKNLDMWMAHCIYDNGTAVNWAIFAGPDGSAQVRDCKDVDATQLPKCEIKKRPKGTFNEL